jgi:putative ABC transport system substrate-binding protein
MRRREFIALLGSLTAAWPVVARGQPKQPKIGVLFPSNPEPVWSLFREALREQGYAEGRNIQFELRSADGKPNLLDELAADLVRLKMDVIVAVQTPAAQAAKQATTEIPIVMSAADPIGTGLVTSLARPGGNITGISVLPPELGGKLLELSRDLLPATRRVAVLANATDPFTKSFVEEIDRSGRILGIAIQTIMIREANDLDAAFAAAAKGSANSVIVQPSLPRKPIIDQALKYRLPTISPTSFFPRDGGLMSYSAKLSEVYRRVAIYVDQILKGAKPADLPVELPTKFELVVNMKTANAIGLSVPSTLLVQADEVIE